MTQTWTLLTALLLAGCVLVETAYQTGFKLAANRVQPQRMFASLIGQPLLWLVIAAWAIEAATWVIVLHRAPLVVAFPVMCLTYATVPIAGVFLLKEKLSRRQIAGVLLVFIGVLAVSFSGAQGGPQ